MWDSEFARESEQGAHDDDGAPHRCIVAGCGRFAIRGAYCSDCREEIRALNEMASAATQKRAGQYSRWLQTAVLIAIVLTVWSTIAVPFGEWALACLRMWFGGIFGGN